MLLLQIVSICVVVGLTFVMSSPTHNCDCACPPMKRAKHRCCGDGPRGHRRHTPITGPYPVILVPGDGGSQLFAKLDNVSDVPQPYCKTNTDGYVSMWINIYELAFIDCFNFYMSLHYNPVTHLTSNTPGVDIITPDFGNTTSIDWLSLLHIPPTQYFVQLSDYLVSMNYSRGVTLRGIPYDFRKAPNELDEVLLKTKQLIEETYRSNECKPCVLIGHSAGCVLTLYFLNTMPQWWKDKYIKAFVSLGGSWAGSNKMTNLIISGIEFGDLPVTPLMLRPLERSRPSSAWMMPSSDFWSADENLVETPYRNYTVADYKDLYDDLNFTVGYSMWLDTKDLTRKLKHPGVTVHCLHGNGVPTRGTLKYNETTWPDGIPDFVVDDGDGTINIRSLRACSRWIGKQKQAVYHKEFPGVNHEGLLVDTEVQEYIKNVVS